MFPPIIFGSRFHRYLVYIHSCSSSGRSTEAEITSPPVHDSLPKNRSMMNIHLLLNKNLHILMRLHFHYMPNIYHYQPIFILFYIFVSSLNSHLPTCFTSSINIGVSIDGAPSGRSPPHFGIVSTITPEPCMGRGHKMSVQNIAFRLRYSQHSSVLPPATGQSSHKNRPTR